MIHGVLNVWKEAGYTSHDVVAKLRGIVHQKKIGHTGTLDPDAVGVLPVCLGKGTGLCSMLTEETKTYEAVLRLGITTDTEDMSGKVLSEQPVTVSEEEVLQCITGFVGEQEQIPPMYSALKVNGKRLYELARQGIELERTPRKVTFYEIQVLEMELPVVRLEVTCSRGTYIRTLCHDIGQKLGCGGCMEHLVRTRVGRFTGDSAHTLTEIEAFQKAGKLDEFLIPTDQMFPDLRSVMAFGTEGKKLAENGNPIPFGSLRESEEENSEGSFCEEKWGDGENFRLYLADGSFVGIYSCDRQRHTTRPVKIFLER